MTIFTRLPRPASQFAAVALLAASLLAAHAAAADEVLREANIPLASAEKAAAAAVEKCLADGYRVTAAVVDRNGTVRAQLRADGAGPHTIDSSRKKAYTAASLRRATTDLAEMIGKTPALQGLRDMNQDILMLGGGLPIFVQNEFVGAIGVGGAPGTQFDDACGSAGLERIGATAKPAPAQ
ncbi:MAG: heme-binding protein [Nitrospiraceae bacterium]